MTYYHYDMPRLYKPIVKTENGNIERMPTGEELIQFLYNVTDTINRQGMAIDRLYRENEVLRGEIAYLRDKLPK